MKRRDVLRVGGVATLATTTIVIAGCSDSSGGSYGEPPPEEPVGGVDLDSVPVGGGLVLGGSKVVVTHPTSDQFKAFSAVCTHQGCLVGDVKDNVIACYCHGSRFSAEDGSVISGPARQPLPEKDISHLW